MAHQDFLDETPDNMHKSLQLAEKVEINLL